MPSRKRVSLKNFKNLVLDGPDLANPSAFIVCRAEPFEADPGEQTRAGYIRTFTISTDAIDREGDKICASGWELENYSKGGTVLYAHNHHGLPIGTPEATWTEPGKLKQRIRFTTREEGEFGYSIGKLVEAGVLKSASVGFQAIEWSIAEDRAGFMPTDFIHQELLENSIVPVPANPEALAEAKGLGIDLPLAAGFERLLDDNDFVVVERDLVEASWKAVRPAKTTVTLLPPPTDRVAKLEAQVLTLKAQVGTLIGQAAASDDEIEFDLEDGDDGLIEIDDPKEIVDALNSVVYCFVDEQLRQLSGRLD